MARPSKFPPELRARAVRMVIESRDQYEHEWTAITTIAGQLGVSAETLRKWVRQAEINAGQRPGTTSEELKELTRLRRENAELRRANEILQSAACFFGRSSTADAPSSGLHRRSPRVRFGVEPICKALQVAPSTYYAARTRPPSARALRDAVMAPIVLALWNANYSVYGAHKLWRAAQRAGHDVGRDQVARLMRELGIRGVRRGRKVFTTRRDDTATRAPDLVQRQFSAARPNALWVTDLTYVPTWSGVAYVCFIVDAFSRMIVGWRVAANMRTDMVLDALEMARWARGTLLEGLVCHSDAGSQFTSVRYGERLAEFGALPSIGSVGDSFDNALAEAVNGLYKAELIRQQGPWRDVDAVELATLGWVHWWNAQRLHGTLNDVPPAEFEANHYRQNSADQLVGAQ